MQCDRSIAAADHASRKAALRASMQIVTRSARSALKWLRAPPLKACFQHDRC